MNPHQAVASERVTQNRVVKLLCDALHYRYLGNLETQENTNLREDDLRQYLLRTGRYTPTLIQKALFELQKAALINRNDELYTANKAVYSLLRYGIPVKEDISQNKVTVQLIDWEQPENNDLAVAEEVTVRGEKIKRPDVVLYVNGIALVVLELKKTSVSVSEGIRQSIGNQQHIFIKPFFTTIQLVLAANDSQGLHYGTTGTEEKFFLKWKEDGDTYQPDELLLDKHIRKFCAPQRLLDILHNFVIFDKGTKKLCRPNQYFGIKEAQRYLARREGGIIWHTQGSGKSLTMVWLAKWILENNPRARLLIVTDRTELDTQIKDVFMGVEEDIKRTRSGQELIAWLNGTEHRLLCSLIHKFGSSTQADSSATKEFIEQIKIPLDFRVKGEFVVFIDECHRTQSGDLHKAMKTLLPEAVFIGFTGTPLLKKDKQKSIEVFGRYIHTYKFDEAVKDGVVLDLLYEARDVDQHVHDQKSIDEWFETITYGMNDLPKAELKQKWGTMQKVLSTKSRLEKIVFDIKKDFLMKPRLRDGRGNAMLVARSIYEACRYYEIFQHFGFKKCAIITSFEPTAKSVKLEHVGEGETEKVEQFETYQRMLRDYGFKDTEAFETFAKDKFKNEPAQMQLLIVVDKLLTGFDAPSCTYLYIDKQMQDHGLFQAICRTNRLGKETEADPYFKEFGYIVDYKNLFNSLNKSISDYTSDAFDAYEEEDVKGLLTNRLDKFKERLEDALEAAHQVCEPVAPPKGEPQFFHYFCGDTSQPQQLKANEEKRFTFYKLVVELIRAYNNIAAEILQAGYTEKQAEALKQKVNYYTERRNSVKLHSGDYIDMKQFEPQMRQMLDMYLTADPSRVLSNFGDATLLQLIVENGINEGLALLPESIKENQESMAEVVENNLTKTIIQQMPVNPAYYERMSVLLVELIRMRKEGAMAYEALLKEYEELAKQVQPSAPKSHYPTAINTAARQALYDNLDQEEELSVVMDSAILYGKHDDWQGNFIKEKHLKNQVLKPILSKYQKATKLEQIFEIIKEQREYK